MSLATHSPTWRPGGLRRSATWHTSITSILQSMVGGLASEIGVSGVGLENFVLEGLDHRVTWMWERVVEENTKDRKL